MAIISKYPSEKVEQMLQEIITILDNHQAPNDLALMVLGNAATNIINTRIAAGQRQKLAESFGQALKSSVESPKHS
ncbi:YejL family protein [Celerinatantimonas diazotrophica]|uniref:UPF0352 protein EV690_3507 n=1 Tax=Celerinatantimonas diazotrophica TaxID=412034 RepID=A0A4V2PNC5_9GAMM|nr:DUF1414 domain-containing protein [Celerinatantimonas diazotrophica]TCK46557.1 hypothetical protein EV690_3507 [Celerinatantimonas diazotrophica]CAG9296607.1 hypothetical protein CEDIAZO_01761 [Celerinatantimonas diazotrophica]